MADDKWQVPARVFIDTSALLHGLKVGTNHPESAHCVTFLDQMEASGGRVFVSALSIAEMRRRRGRAAFEVLPHVRMFVTIPLNAEAAHVCGDLFPWPQGEPDDIMARLKFDIAIVASAVWLQRMGEDVTFVSIDDKQSNRARENGLTVATPGSFQPKQLRLIESKPSDSKGSR